MICDTCLSLLQKICYKRKLLSTMQAILSRHRQAQKVALLLSRFDLTANEPNNPRGTHRMQPHVMGLAGLNHLASDGFNYQSEDDATTGQVQPRLTSSHRQVFNSLEPGEGSSDDCPMHFENRKRTPSERWQQSRSVRCWIQIKTSHSAFSDVLRSVTSQPKNEHTDPQNVDSPMGRGCQN